MNFTFYLIKQKVKKKLVKTWYFIMKPVAYFFTTEKINKRYNKRKSKITIEKAAKWISEDIARYILKYNRTEHFLICKSASEDDFWSGCRIDYSSVKRKKSRMAMGKFYNDLEMREKVIEYLKKIKHVIVNEEVEEIPNWKYIVDYKKTVIIKPKKSK